MIHRAHRHRRTPQFIRTGSFRSGRQHLPPNGAAPACLVSCLSGLWRSVSISRRKRFAVGSTMDRCRTTASAGRFGSPSMIFATFSLVAAEDDGEELNFLMSTHVH